MMGENGAKKGLRRCHVGKRVLLREALDAQDERSYQEARVLEISPSGKRVRLRIKGGGIAWCGIDAYVVEEVLKDLPRPRKKRKR